ncbi:MAG: YfgM family protein [Pigmentiphaga sp.]
MTYDLEEQEQLDALKAWWAKYGNAILTLITLILLAVAAWQWWNWHQRNQAGQAAAVFEALQTATAQGQSSQVLDASARLQDDYARTVYASRGALLAAGALAEAGDTAAARERLQWVVDQGGLLAPVARLRLAALLIDADEGAQALALLDATPAAGFEALYADRRGDALFALGRGDEAAQAWREAVERMGPADPLVSVVRLKIEALLPEEKA